MRGSPAPLVGVRQSEGDGGDRDEDPVGGPPARAETTARKKAAVQPLLADAGGEPDDGEQPPLPRRPRQERQRRVRRRLGVPPFPGTAHAGPGRRLQQHAAAQRPGRDQTKTSTQHGHRPDDRAGPRLRPPQPDRGGVDVRSGGPHEQGEQGQSPLEHEQPPVERPAGAVVPAQPPRRSGGAARARRPARRRRGSPRR